MLRRRPGFEGDIELHLHAADWAAHAMPATQRMTALFCTSYCFRPKTATSRVERTAGNSVLALLPLLHHDLEAFAADDAVETLAQRPAGRSSKNRAKTGG